VIRPVFVLVLSTDDFSWNTVRRTEPPSPTCGLTRSVKPTSLRSTVWKGLELPELLLVYCPVTKGTFLPTTIFASSLSSEIMLGLESTLPSALVCKKVANAAKP